MFCANLLTFLSLGVAGDWKFEGGPAHFWVYWACVTKGRMW